MLGPALDFASVFVFALTGGIAAARAGLDPVGFLFLAGLTALGGGTVRDLLLDRDPVFWMARPSMLAVAALAAGIVFLAAHRFEPRARALAWFDAAALAIAVPAGAQVAVSLGEPWPIAAIMGVATGCLGGLMRDVVCNEVPFVLRAGELYATAAAGGALVTVALLEAGLPGLVAALAGAGCTFALRAGSLVFGWRLPAYRPRPPR